MSTEASSKTVMQQGMADAVIEQLERSIEAVRNSSDFSVIHIGMISHSLSIITKHLADNITGDIDAFDELYQGGMIGNYQDEAFCDKLGVPTP